MLLTDLSPSTSAFLDATGWKIEPRGACKGPLCVPLGDGALDGDRVDATVVAERLGMAVVEATSGGLWAVGPESFAGTALTTVEAPDLTLETFDGEPFRLSSLRGTRTVLVSWAPY